MNPTNKQILTSIGQQPQVNQHVTVAPRTQQLVEAGILPARMGRYQTAALTRRQKVFELWLVGRTHMEIALEVGASLPQVAADVRDLRRELYHNNQATLSEHVEQTVVVLRRLESELWAEYDGAVDIGLRLKLLEQIRRTEETVAKSRGLLSDRVVGSITHHVVKHYDFQDRTPAAPDGGSPHMLTAGEGIPASHPMDGSTETLAILEGEVLQPVMEAAVGSGWQETSEDATDYSAEALLRAAGLLPQLDKPDYSKERQVQYDDSPIVSLPGGSLVDLRG